MMDANDIVLNGMLSNMLAEKGIEGAPCVSAASALLSQPGLEAYSSTWDQLQQSLACIHTDLLVLLFRSELAFGLRRASRQAIKDFEEAFSLAACNARALNL